jgi:hypothetical protein
MIMHRKIHKVRMLIAAAIGGIYSIFEIVVNINSILSIIITIIISIVICLISFKEKKFKGFVAMYLIFWGVSASIGGLMSLLYTFLNKVLYCYIFYLLQSQQLIAEPQLNFLENLLHLL